MASPQPTNEPTTVQPLTLDNTNTTNTQPPPQQPLTPPIIPSPELKKDDIQTQTEPNPPPFAPSSNPLPPTPTIPAQAKQFTFGCQIMIINLNTRTELNKKLGFVIGDYKPYSKRIPIRLITNTDSSTAPTYLLKLSNLQFVSQPIPGYDVIPYKSETNLSDSDSDISSHTDTNSSDTSSDESSLSPTITHLQSMNINQDFDIKSDCKTSEQKLQKINENTMKYYDIMKEFNKPPNIDVSPSITSTKSLPIDCGLRWEPKPVTESVENMGIEKIGTIANVINDIEIVIESIHNPQSVITFDSVICIEDKTVIGRVDDIFGAVKKPYYFVRLTVDKAVILKDKMTLGQSVFAVKPLSTFVIPPKSDERYSSASECESNNSSDEDQYRPKSMNKNRKKVQKNDRRRRAMSVDRESVIGNGNGNRNRNNRRGGQPYKRKYYNSNNGFGYGNKRQRYSNPNITTPVYANRNRHTHTSAYHMHNNYYNAFTALPSAIPPPQTMQNVPTPVMTPATAAYFRPQVNIIPSPPKYYMNLANSQSPQQVSVSPNMGNNGNSVVMNQTPPQQQIVQAQQHITPPQQQQRVTQNVNASISINPFSFTKSNTPK